MWYNLLKNPEKFHKAQQEVDEVVGDKVVSLDMLPHLHYIDACIKETLRLNSPVPIFNVLPFEDTHLAGGRYHVTKDDLLMFNLKGLHHDPKVWGVDHNEFNPERFLDGGFAALPPNSWKPFGNGLRACIGRGFAEQEMLLNTAMVLQKFSPELADPSYELELRSTLTVKPTGFFMKMRRRPGKSWLTGVPGGALTDQAQKHQRETESKSGSNDSTGTTQKVKIFYGGNSGTCEGFAQSLQATLSERKMQAEIANLDTAAENLNKQATNIIITASYEGQPPDNARKFVTWLERQKDAELLKGVNYSVMGVGNSDWATTFHRIPKLVDVKMAELGAEAIAPAGYSNVKADLVGPFDEWVENVVKGLVGSAAASEEKPSLSVTVERSKVAQEIGDEKMGIGTVMKNDQLADTSIGLEKKHMEVRLPEDTTYQAGDYLVIQPRNPDEAVQKVMRFFEFDEQTEICVDGSSEKVLAENIHTGRAVPARTSSSLGLRSRSVNSKSIAGYAKDDQKHTLMDDDTYDSLMSKRYTVFNVLTEYSVDLPFAIYCDMLIPLTPRQYSISSSPLAPGYEDTASITYDVLTEPALSGTRHLRRRMLDFPGLKETWRPHILLCSYHQCWFPTSQRRRNTDHHVRCRNRDRAHASFPSRAGCDRHGRWIEEVGSSSLVLRLPRC